MFNGQYTKEEIKKMKQIVCKHRWVKLLNGDDKCCKCNKIKIEESD